MSLNYRRIFRILKSLLRDSQTYRNDDARSNKLANDALKKAARNQSALGRAWDDLSSLIRLIQAWANGSYRAVPWRSISLAIAALLYFVSPIDAIPDFLPVLGFLDDIFVVTWVMRSIQKDLEKFKIWEQSSGWVSARGLNQPVLD